MRGQCFYGIVYLERFQFSFKCLLFLKMIQISFIDICMTVHVYMSRFHRRFLQRKLGNIIDNDL